MGIFPYHTPYEWEAIDRSIKHYDFFCALRGYKKTFPSDGPWLAKNGKTYTNREEFRKDNGPYPFWEKDGISYGCYEVGEIEGYKRPHDEENKFLQQMGYKYLQGQHFSKDYMEDISLSEKFYKENGWLPRWKKDGKLYGHRELLISLGFKYDGEPEWNV